MDFLEEINGKYDTLSSVQKRIADYMFTYPDEVCFQSLKEISEALGVTEVTVLRFVKKIGLNSYVELKKRMKEYLHMRLNQEESVSRKFGHGYSHVQEEPDTEHIYHRFVENELQVLKNTYEQISMESVQNAVSIIKQAKMVYVVGHELGTAASSYLTRRLLTIGIRAIDLGAESRAIYNNYMTHISSDDAVIIFSNPGYAKHLVNTVKYLEKKSVPQIVITDKESAPVAAYATVTLTSDNHDLYFYNSVLGFYSIANLLAYFTAIQNPEETGRLRRQISETREAIGSISVTKERK